MSICENYVAIKHRVEAAAKRAGRAPEDITLIAVTKFVEIPRIEEALPGGVTDVGENRVQDLKEKLNFFELHGLRTHLIGQLQTNKVKYVCNQVGLIQSVDRLELLAKLEQQSLKNNGMQDILIQVNIGDESQKGGVSLVDLPALFESAVISPHLNVRGLMCVPPAVEGELVRPYFKRMYELYREFQRKYPDCSIDTLSMGMSHDFELAIEEGATMVRVGTAIFGQRIVHKV